MRILEQSGDVLTLQASAREFWCDSIFFLLVGLPSILFALLLLLWFGQFPLSIVALCILWLGVKQIWSNSGVKKCSLNKATDKVILEFHGLQTTIKELRFQEIREVKVIKTRAVFYASVFEDYQIWLSLKCGEAIPLSERCGDKACVESIAGQVRKFLNLSSY
jgi:hypothetical protein